MRSFCEPCAGEGDLIRHLRSFGLTCVFQGDIATGQDALTVSSFPAPVVTNPPWRREVMHALIAHFMEFGPFCWLLVDLDWSATKQAVPFMKHCSDIVVVGRVRWIPNTKMDGKENCAWYRFEAEHRVGPVYHPRVTAGSERPSLMTRTCRQCARPYEPVRTDQRFCSAACKQRAYRLRFSAVTQA